MAVGTETADVAVVVAAALGERYNVVRHGGLANDALGSAVPAERFSLQAPQPLSDGPASAKSFGHEQAPEKNSARKLDRKSVV